MADSYIQYPDDVPNTGKKLRVQSRAVGADTVHEQYHIITDETTDTQAPVSASIPVGTEAGLYVRVVSQPAGGGSSGGLTNTELRATPVPISGTVTATGPLTDTQLRAAAVPVSGPVTANAGTNLNTSALALDATLTGGTQKKHQPRRGERHDGSR